MTRSPFTPEQQDAFLRLTGRWDAIEIPAQPAPDGSVRVTGRRFDTGARDDRIVYPDGIIIAPQPTAVPS